MSAVEWADIVVRVVFGTLSLAWSIFMLFLLWHVFRFLTGHFMGRRNGSPSLRVFLRRPFCRHHVIARTRDAYGRNYTACARCGTDVNEGKPREAWR